MYTCVRCALTYPYYNECNFLWNYAQQDLNVFLLAHRIYFKLKILHIHIYVTDSFYVYDTVTVSFIVVMSASGMLMYPGYLIKFPPFIILTQCASVLYGLISQTNWMYVTFLQLVFGIGI